MEKNYIDSISFSKLISEEIKIFCKPLKTYLSIHFFGFFRVYNNYKYLILSNNPEFNEEYITQIKSGSIFFNEYVEANDNYRHILWPKYPTNSLMDFYIKHDIWHGVTLVPKLSIKADFSRDFTDYYTFVGNNESSNVNFLYYRHPRILEQFVEYFKAKFTDILNKKFDDKNLAIFEKGVDLSIPNLDNQQNNYSKNKIQEFLNLICSNNHNLGIDIKNIKLSTREKECLALISSCYSNKEIAKELSLSLRTIEVHLANLKNKTGTYSRSQLNKLFNQLSL